MLKSKKKIPLRLKKYSNLSSNANFFKKNAKIRDVKI